MSIDTQKAALVAPQGKKNSAPTGPKPAPVVYLRPDGTPVLDPDTIEFLESLDGLSAPARRAVMVATRTVSETYKADPNADQGEPIRFIAGHFAAALRAEGLPDLAARTEALATAKGGAL